MTKNLRLKTKNLRLNKKVSGGRKEDGSCGMDSMDLFVINQKFSDIYETSKKKAFRYLQQQSKEFGFDPREMQMSLLEGGKSNEMDIRPNGDLYGTVGDDAIEFNPNSNYGEGPARVRVWGYFGDDIIANNIGYYRGRDSLYPDPEGRPDPRWFRVNAWGGGGKDHFSAGNDAVLYVNDMEEGETVTLTGLKRPGNLQLGNYGHLVQMRTFEDVNWGGDFTIAAAELPSDYENDVVNYHPGSKIHVFMASPNLTLQDMGETDTGNGTFSHTFKAVTLIQGGDGTDVLPAP